MLELKLLGVKSYRGMDTVFSVFLLCRGPLVGLLIFAAINCPILAFVNVHIN